MNYKNEEVKLRLIIPFPLLRKGFSSLLLSLGYQLQSSHISGIDMMAALSADDLSHIVLVDVDRPESAAMETTAWLKEHYPSVKVVALCMKADESLINPLLDSGAVGYIFIHAAPSQIKKAIKEVFTKGYYFPYWLQAHY